MRVLAALGVTCLLVHAQSSVRREGGAWVFESSGEIPVAGNQLRVETHGDLILSGLTAGTRAGSAPVARWRMVRRIAGVSRAEAQALMASHQLRASRARLWTYLSVDEPPAGLRVSIEIAAPPEVATARVFTSGGNVSVRDLAASVEAESLGGAIKADLIRGQLVARTGGGEILIGRVAGATRAWTGGGAIQGGYLGGEARLESSGGTITVHEAKGSLHAWTDAGDIEIGKAQGPVIAETRGGIIRVDEAAGKVEAFSHGGPIRVNAARGVRCESSAGAVRLDGVSGQVRVLSSAGSILASLAALGLVRDSLLQTGSGDVTVWIPSNLAVTVQVAGDTMMDRWLISDFPEIRALTPAGAGRSAAGNLNGGGPMLRVSASNGIVYLRRGR